MTLRRPGSLVPGLVVRALTLFLAHASFRAVVAQTPTAGQNINMVSGTTWPGGDPFLQRQNEPSLAVSSRNSLHLLAGANDYRTVDLPVSDTVPGSLAGDAWLGVFKSYDGGLTWQSYLLPGYPQDNSTPASPLKAYSAAADPTVRAGTGGLFYYSGIAFNRGTNNGAVFVSTYFDTNVKENGSAPAGKDAIQYTGTTLVDTGTSGQFLDKTWIAVDIPRSGAGMCTFNVLGQTQTVAAGNVYVVWSRFTGSQSTKIMFSRSLDCGKTWSNPTKLSESSSINQGTNVAIDPANGKVYVAWRQFATSSNPDSIIVARSDDYGATFPSKNTNTVATITAFDQPTSGTRFRTNALPSIAVSVDSGGTSRVHVVWAQRVGGINNDARIVMSTSSNDGKSWSSPSVIDAFGGSVASGHQFMPQITFSAGRLMVVYYDQRLDHTLALFKPTDTPFLGLYTRTQAPRGELVSPGGLIGPGLVFRPFIDDDPGILPLRRHTIDLRVAEALPAPTPSFSSTLVSQYRMGLWAPDSNGVFHDDENAAINPDSLYQLQVNAPNLPMFSLGTLPFLGDYIDIAGQNFVTNSSGVWGFNTSAANPPVFYATWTDNRDVVPPADSTGFVDWKRYTPPGSTTVQHPSVLDPSQTVPLCQPAYTGSRNQNIYMSRITEGLLVGSPQDAKPLSASLERAFVVTLQNQTKEVRTFHLTIANQPAGGQASFVQGTVSAGLDVTIPGGAGAARPIFAKASNPAASFTVTASEAGGLGLAGSVVFNPEGSVSPLAQPEGTTVDIAGAEIYTPAFQVWNASNPNPYVNISDPNASLLQNISNQNISNQNISNADPAIQNISNQNISNQNISNQNISNQNISNPSPAVQNISNQNISNQNISNTTAANQNISNQNISNQNISNQNISNDPISDATYAVTNTGNTTHSYRIALYGQTATAPPLQLIVTKNSSTPVSVNCALQSVPQSISLARADGPPVTTSLSDASQPNIPLGDATNATVPIAPGETVFVTLRGKMSQAAMAALAQQLTPVVTAHGKNTNGITPDFALLLSIRSAGGSLASAVVGFPYSVSLQSTGGTAPITWTVVSGSLPAGLTLSSAGVISGTPSATGTFAFTLQVADSTSPVPQKFTQSFTIAVTPRPTTAIVSLSPASIAATATSAATVTVTDANTSVGTPSVPTGAVTVSGSGGATGGGCTLTPTAAPYQASCNVNVAAPSAGSYTITGLYAGSTVHMAPATPPTATLTVTEASTSTSLSLSSSTAVVGQPVTVTANVAATSPGITASPTGTVTFSSSVGTDTFAPASKTCSLVATGSATAGCSVSVTANSASPHTISAIYAGVSGVLTTSTGTGVINVSQRSTSSSVAVSPNPVLAGQPATVTVTVSDTEPSGTKSNPTGTVTLASNGTGDSFTPSAGCTLVAGAAGISSCSASASGNAVGVRTLTANYGGSGAYVGSSGTASLTIKGNTTTSITGDSPAPSGLGQAITVSFTVAPASPATGSPTGSVTVTDGTGATCTAALSAGGCTLVPGAAGTLMLTATYSGDAFFFGSSSTRLHTVIAPYTFTGFLSPLSPAGTLSAPSDSGTGNFTKGVPLKWQVRDSSGAFLSSLTTTQTLYATYYVGGVCTAGAATGPVSVLYLPTSGATGGSTFRYDPSNNQFLFNWSTKSLATGAGCYEVVLQLNDGSAPKATKFLLQ